MKTEDHVSLAGTETQKKSLQNRVEQNGVGQSCLDREKPAQDVLAPGPPHSPAGP